MTPNILRNITEKVPKGPLGLAGDGQLLGAGGYVAVEAADAVWQFVPGLKRPGFKITGHGTTELKGDSELHELTIVAISEDVASFAAQYTSAPSNIHYINSDIKVTDLKKVTERPPYSTYKIEVEVSPKE